MNQDNAVPPELFRNDRMIFRFSLYGFLKNLRFFEPFLLLMFRDGGLSFLQIGLLYSVRDITTNLFEIPAGFLADSFGRRRAMVFSFTAYIFSFLMFFFYQGFLPFTLAMIVFALAEALRTGTHKALILEHLKLEGIQHLKVSYYGRTRSASQLGSALNALLAALLVFATGNYRYIFLAATIPYVLDLFNLISYPAALDGERIQLNARDIPQQFKTTFAEFIQIFRQRRAIFAILNSSGYSAGFKSIKDYLQPILESFALGLPLLLVVADKQRSALVIGAVYFIIYLSTSYASRQAANFSARFKQLSQAINITFMIGAVLVIFAGVSTILNLSLLSILIFVGLFLLLNLRRPMNVGYISDQIPDHVMASGLSVESQATTLLMALFAPILGFLADRLGVGTALAFFGAGLLLFSLFARVQSTTVEREQ
jgi:MFS family permease